MEFLISSRLCRLIWLGVRSPEFWYFFFESYNHVIMTSVILYFYIFVQKEQFSIKVITVALTL